MSIDTCPTTDDLVVANAAPHGTGSPASGTMPFNAATESIDAARSIAGAARRKTEYATGINDAIGADANGPSATKADQSALRSVAKNLATLVRTAQEGIAGNLRSFDDAVKLLGGLTTGEESLWLDMTCRLESYFSDSKGPYHRWVMLKAVDPTKAMNQQELIASQRSMDARINAVYDRIHRNKVEPIMQFVAPIAKRLGYSNRDMAIILGDYANALAVPEKNAELLRRWDAELQAELAKPKEKRNASLIGRLERQIEDLETFIDEAEDLPDGLLSCGYTNGQASDLIRRITDLGVTEAEGVQFSKLMTDWSYEILMERARGGTLDPGVLQRFPLTFTNYVPFQNRFENHTGAVNETRTYNPGSYHAMEGSRTAPDSSFLTLLAYSRRAANEVGMQDFGIKLATKAILDAANNVDNGLRIYKKSDIDRLKNDRNPAISQWARNFDTHGGLVVDIPQYKGGVYVGHERSYVCFDPNWKDPVANLDGSVLNEALVSAPKISGGLHKFAVANSWYGQMFTRMTGFFSPVNCGRDLIERSYHLASMTTYDANGREVQGNNLLWAYFGNIANSASMLRDAVRGIAAPDSDAAIFWNEYQAMGLYQEYTPGMNSSNRTMSDIMAEQSNEGRVKHALGKATNAKLRRAFNELGRNKETALRVIDQWNGYFTTVAPFNMFVTMRRAGISAERAGNNVLESMNMTRRGTLTPVLQAFFPFVKPTMNSAAAMARSLGLVYDPRGFITAGKNGWKYMLGTTMAYAMLQPLLSDSMGTDPETGMKRMDMLSLSDLARALPIGIGDGNYIKFPSGYGPVQLPIVLVNGIDRVLRGLMTPEDFGFEMLFTTAKNMMAGNWPEFGFTEDPIDYLAQMFTPSFLNTFTQIATNRGYFGQPITYGDENSADRAMADQGRVTTPPVYHTAARGILDATGMDFAPEQIRAVANGIFIGPLRLLRSLLEYDSQYKVAKEHALLDDHNNLFIAGLKALGATQLLGSVQNEGRQFFFQAADYYERRIKQSGVKLTSTEYGNDREARIAYQTGKLLDAGFTQDEIDDILLIRDTVQSMRQANKRFNDATRTTWLTANDSTELRTQLMELANQEADIYDEAVPQLHFFGRAR